MLIDLAHKLIRSRYIRLGFASETVPLGRTNVHYYHYKNSSSKRIIVLLHGLGTSSSTWFKIVSSLQQHFTIFAPDLPGYGFSTIDNAQEFFSLPELNESFSMFIDRMGLHHFALVGHSMGGWIAGRYSSQHADRIDQLILINPTGVYYPGVEHLREYFTLRSTADFNRLVERMWHNYPWYFKPFSLAILHDMRKRRINEFVNSIRSDDFLVEELTTLRMPVNVVWGSNDGLLSAGTLSTLQKFIPQLQVTSIERCGHIPQLEAPHELSRALVSILRMNDHGVA
jgi:abhydrolase domain-containing protein 6